MKHGFCLLVVVGSSLGFRDNPHTGILTRLIETSVSTVGNHRHVSAFGKGRRRPAASTVFTCDSPWRIINTEKTP